jgi:hypothetical protein
MENNTENFSPEESLKIIQTMIERTKHAVADRSFYFLLWGWLVFVAALTQYVLKVILHSPWHPAAWNLMFVGWVGSTIYEIRDKRTRRVKSHIDDNLRNLWIGITICNLLLVFYFAIKGTWQECYTFFMLLYGIGCFITGLMLKFTPMVWGGIFSWLLVIVSVFTGYDNNILLLSLAILVSYIIPGYLLRREYRKEKMKHV